jgi:hypothetical protein
LKVYILKYTELREWEAVVAQLLLAFTDQNCGFFVMFRDARFEGGF